MTMKTTVANARILFRNRVQKVTLYFSAVYIPLNVALVIVTALVPEAPYTPGLVFCAYAALISIIPLIWSLHFKTSRNFLAAYLVTFPFCEIGLLYSAINWIDNHDTATIGSLYILSASYGIGAFHHVLFHYFFLSQQDYTTDMPGDDATSAAATPSASNTSTSRYAPAVFVASGAFAC